MSGYPRHPSLPAKISNQQPMHLQFLPLHVFYHIHSSTIDYIKVFHWMSNYCWYNFNSLRCNLQCQRFHAGVQVRNRIQRKVKVNKYQGVLSICLRVSTLSPSQSGIMSRAFCLWSSQDADLSMKFFANILSSTQQCLDQDPKHGQVTAKEEQWVPDSTINSEL
jgi:hypothetical protein